MGQAVLSNWMIVDSINVYDYMTSIAAEQSVSYHLMANLSLCGTLIS